MLYLVCTQDGYVIDVIYASSMQEAASQTTDKNYGEFLVELDKEAINLFLKAIKKMLKKRVIDFIERI